MKKRILVCYATGSGSTGEVAEAIGEVLSEAGTLVDVKNVKDVSNVRPFSAVVIGSSIRSGRWLQEAIQFLEVHGDALREPPIALFTTCLTMVEGTEAARKTVLAYMEPVLRKIPEIEPVSIGLFAGSLDPDRRLILPESGGPYGDYRDWEAIRGWAKRIRPSLLEGEFRASEPPVLKNAILSFTDMSGYDLRRSDFSRSKLIRVKLTESNLREATLVEVEMRKAELSGADLQHADLSWANLNESNLRGARLSQAHLVGTNLKGADLRDADLSCAIMNGANLSKANLTSAELPWVDLNWADLQGAILDHANLHAANLGWADLRDADLRNSNLHEARFNNQTKWPENFSPQMAGCLLVEDIY